jgi:hypothetical protein
MSLEEGYFIRFFTQFNYIVRKGIANGDTTHVYSSLNFEETGISPFNTPRVLDNPIVNSIFSTISNSKDCMVNI